MSNTLSLSPRTRRTLSISGLALLWGLATGCGQDPDAVTPLGSVDNGAEIRVPSGMVDSSLDALFRQMGSDDIGTRTDLQATAGYADDLAIVHTRFRQHVDGIPVFGGEAIVHLRGDGSTFAVTDRLQRGLRVDSKAKLNSQRAIALALEHHGGSSGLTADPKAELFVLRHGGQDRLVYRVQLRQEDGTDKTSLPVFFIDAHTGENVLSYDNLQTATGSGTSLYVGNVSVETNLKSGVYYLEDLGRRMGTFDSRNSTAQTYRFTDSDNVWNSSTQQAAVDAHYGAAKVYDYFLNVHGRRGIDGNGGPGYYKSIDGVTPIISSRVHYSRKYNNAFWNGSLMTYGDGDGTTFTPLVTLDICGHEMTHGVTERTAALVYQGESGALNESFSDVFGAMVERYVRGESADTWKIGEEAYTPTKAGDALRYMDNPHLAGNAGYTSDDDPDHYSERYTGTSDNGGVHINSGIANKAFYLDCRIYRMSSRRET